MAGAGKNDVGVVIETERLVLAAILADAMTDVVADLRTVDPVDLVSFIRFGSFPALDDLVQSSTELFFRDATLVFGWTAHVNMAWGDQPAVTLGMEFHSRGVSVFFDLRIGTAGLVTITSIQFEAGSRDAVDRERQLAASLAAARLTSRAR